ncbi:MAG: hypothetical protein AAF670_11215 [Planctomycetota bacterium]
MISQAPRNISAAATAKRTLFLTQPNRPPRSEVIVDNIPEEIKQLKRWVCWARECRDKKWAKGPKQCNGRFAKSTSSDTWESFENVLAAYQSDESMAGIGFVLGDGYAGIDLDSCYDADDDVAEDSVHEVVELIGSYAEISPTQTGLKILVKGKLPKGRRSSGADAEIDVECYDGGRFFTTTGQCWAGGPSHIRTAESELAQFHRTYVDPREPEKPRQTPNNGDSIFCRRRSTKSPKHGKQSNTSPRSMRTVTPIGFGLAWARSPLAETN